MDCTIRHPVTHFSPLPAPSSSSLPVCRSPIIGIRHSAEYLDSLLVEATLASASSGMVVDPTSGTVDPTVNLDFISNPHGDGWFAVVRGATMVQVRRAFRPVMVWRSHVGQSMGSCHSLAFCKEILQKKKKKATRGETRLFPPPAPMKASRILLRRSC